MESVTCVWNLDIFEFKLATVVLLYSFSNLTTLIPQ